MIFPVKNGILRSWWLEASWFTETKMVSLNIVLAFEHLLKILKNQQGSFSCESCIVYRLH